MTRVPAVPVKNINSAVAEWHSSIESACRLRKLKTAGVFFVYLSEYRIEKAKQLLADVVNNVKDISIKVGYRDSNYFAKVFKLPATGAQRDGKAGMMKGK